MSQRKWDTKSYDAPGVQEILSPELCYEYSHVSRIFLLVCSNKQTLTLGTSWNSAGQIADDTCFRQDWGKMSPCFNHAAFKPPCRHSEVGMVKPVSGKCHCCSPWQPLKLSSTLSGHILNEQGNTQSHAPQSLLHSTMQ